MRVYSVPVDGSSRAVERLRETRPDVIDPYVALGGSAQRAAIAIEGADAAGRTMHLFGGPPAGPWTELAPPVREDDGGFFSQLAQVDGDRLFTVEGRAAQDEYRRFVREGAAAPRELGSTTSSPRTAYAGDFEAYEDRPDGGVVVRNWRTGEQRVLAVPNNGFDVREDGALVVDDGAGIRVIPPSGKGKRIARDGYQPRWAGDRIVYLDGVQLMVVDPGRRPRAFGVPSRTLDEFHADARRVLWTANGCVLTADLTEPAATAPKPGVCARTEIDLDDPPTPPRIPSDRHARLYVHCVAAPRACRGWVRLSRLSTTARFRIPVGQRRRLVVRLSRSGYAAARRAADDDGTVGLSVTGATIDPDGRRSRFDDLYAATVR
jgi:hypothetical protein